MIVSMWMTRDVVTVEPGTSITDAAALMAAKRIRRLPVVERHADGPRLVGIVSATDLFRAFPPHLNPFSITAPDTPQSRVTVAEIMNRHLVTTTPDAPIEQAAQLMRDNKIGALPVVQKGALVGLITESDIFRAFVGLFESPPGGVRITFDVSKSEDLFGLVAQLAGRRGVRVVGLISSQQNDRSVCVVRVTGGAIDDFLDDIWNSGHHVLNVLRLA
jgi:acetoin utilization protein AcuB